MRKFLLCLLLVIGIVTLIGVNMASARGWFRGDISLNSEAIVERQNQMFEDQASLLGISVGKVKEYWAQGKSIKEIAEEMEIDDENLQEKMKQARREKIKVKLQILVDNGVVTQAQADQRLQIMEERFENERTRGMRRGFGKGFG